MTRRLRRAFPVLLLSLLVPAAAARAHPGTGIAVDRQGRVYFTDLKRIWRRDPGGRLTAVVEGKHSHAIRLAEDGSLEGEHVTYDGSRFWTSAWNLSPGGALRETAPPTEGVPFLFTPAVTPDGTRYYARVDNNRRDASEIHRRTADGRTELFAGGVYGYADGVGGEARFGPIGALVVGPGGDLYITDEASVRRVTASGRVTTIARGGPFLESSLFARIFGGRFGKMMGLAVDGRGNVFAANYGGACVVRITPEGRVMRVLKSKGGWAPSGVALSGADLYVLEFGRGDSVRVRRVTGAHVEILAVIRAGKPEKP